MFRFLLAFSIALSVLQALPPFQQTPDIASALDRISAGSLRVDISYLASDQLDGRDTPSHGLTLAADFLARRFAEAGLEPARGSSYLQLAKMELRTPNLVGFQLKLARGKEEFQASADQVTLRVSNAVDLTNVALFKIDPREDNSPDLLSPANINGRVVMLEDTHEAGRRIRVILRQLQMLRPAAVIFVDPQSSTVESRKAELIDPSEESNARAPRFTIHGGDAMKFYSAVRPGATGVLASIHLSKLTQSPVEIPNVVGLLRGSDRALKETYVLVSAHYDHLGNSNGRVYHGANDDGSGTASLIEVANALAHLKQRPRRSLVFIAFFGEEEGLKGSRYYAHHPVFPIEKTVVDINLEQLGRTDATEGPRAGTISVTGEDFTNLTDFFEAAGKLTGVKVNHDPRNSEAYFAASDNYSLAEVGVPAETLAVAFQYPDYHGFGDTADKIDYSNLVKVDRMTALAALMLAESASTPEWNVSNAKTEPFRRAEKNHGTR